MSFELDEYVPETMANGDKLKPSDVIDHPLIVKVLDYKAEVTTKFSPNGDGECVIVDVLDLTDQKVHLGVMWFNNAIRDNLKNKVGKTMPIRLIYQAPKKAGGNPYIVPAGLEGADLEAARAWASEKPTIFSDERKERDLGEYGSEMPDAKEQGNAFPAATPVSTPSATLPPKAMKPPAGPTAIQPPAANAPAVPDASEDDDDIPF